MPDHPHCWDDTPPISPAHLYALFGAQAVSERLLPEGVDDHTLNLIFDCVALATTVALAAAGVDESWTPQYMAALTAVPSE
jgi:hypothetical protein